MPLINELKVQGSEERKINYIYKGKFVLGGDYKPNDVYYKTDGNYYTINYDNEEVSLGNNYPMLDASFNASESLSADSLNNSINSSLIMTNALENFLNQYGQTNKSMEDKLVNIVKRQYNVDNSNLIYNFTVNIGEDSNADYKNNKRGNYIQCSINGEARCVIKAKNGIYIDNHNDAGGLITHTDDLSSSTASNFNSVISNVNNSNYWNFNTKLPYAVGNSYGHVSVISMYNLYTPTKPNETRVIFEINKDIDRDWNGNYLSTLVIENDARLLAELRDMSQNPRVTLEVVLTDKTTGVDCGSIFINGLNFTYNSSINTYHRLNNYIRYKIVEISGSSSYGSGTTTYYGANLEIDGEDFPALSDEIDDRYKHISYRTRVQRVIFHYYAM